MSSFGAGVAALALNHGKCDGVANCVSTYAGAVDAGLTTVEPVLNVLSPSFKAGVTAFADAQKVGGLLYANEYFAGVKGAAEDLVEAGTEAASATDLVADIGTTAAVDTEAGSEVSAAASALTKTGVLFGAVSDALGVVADVAGAVVDAIDAAAAFAKGGVWNDVDGAMAVVKGVGALAVVGATPPSHAYPHSNLYPRPRWALPCCLESPTLSPLFSR